MAKLLIILKIVSEANNETMGHESPIMRSMGENIKKVPMAPPPKSKKSIEATLNSLIFFVLIIKISENKASMKTTHLAELRTVTYRGTVEPIEKS